MTSDAGKRSVIVRGFDFGTTHEQIANHMSSAGRIEKIDPVIHEKYGTVDRGVVRITYATAEEAKWASSMEQTIIPGNSRYIEVITLDPHAFLAEQPNIDPERAQQFLAMYPEQQNAVMAKGSLASARDPTAVLVQRMNQSREAGIGGKAFDSPISDGRSVLVRGFDFGTTHEQIANHMSNAGKIEKIDPVIHEKFGTVDRGVVRVTYATAEEAKIAVQLEQTIIPGNTRYLEVMPLDPKEFLAPHNIDSDKAFEFSALTPAQQLSVMVKGSLSSARNPNAVLATRMTQARLIGKEGFGKAQGKGNTGNGPYGGGGMGNGGDMNQMNQMMLQMMQLLMNQMMETAKPTGTPSGTTAGSSAASMETMAGSSNAPMAGAMGAMAGAMGGTFGAPMGAMAGSLGAPTGTMPGAMSGSPGATTGGNPMEAILAALAAMSGSSGLPQS